VSQNKEKGQFKKAKNVSVLPTVKASLMSNRKKATEKGLGHTGKSKNQVHTKILIFCVCYFCTPFP